MKFNYEKSRATLKHGWLAFVKDNNLKVGDVCVFTLIEDIVMLSFQVEFFGTTGAASFHTAPGKSAT